MANALNNRVALDGGNTPSASLPMGGMVHTNVGAATSRTNYARASQVQDASMISAATTGTDAVTATLSPAITAYAAGAIYSLKSAGSNTGAMTINLNGVGAGSVKKGKAGTLDLSAGDFAAGRMGLFAHDGTNFQMLNAPEFPSGTRMLFQQTAAPVGWTKDATLNDRALRVVSGAVVGGGTGAAFSAVFSASRTPAGTVGGTAITEANLPSHRHFMYADDSVGTVTIDAVTFAQWGDGASGDQGYVIKGTSTADATIGLSSATGSGTTHTHTFTGAALSMDVLYTDVIVAQKD